MNKYRICKGFNSFVIYRMKNEGNGWSKEFLSRYETREAAEKAINILKEQEARYAETDI